MNPLIGLILAAIPFGAPPEPLAPDPKLTELVRRLGHKSFAAREAAARDLVTRGTAAVPALTAGTTDPDPEVAERCRKLLPAAANWEVNQKLAQLLKDPAGPPPTGLAGVETFLKITGDDAAARRLYAEMMGGHRAIIEALEADPKAGSRLMNDFCDAAYERWDQILHAKGNPTHDILLTDRGQAALFLFARADRRFTDSSTGAQRLIGFQVEAPVIRETIAGPGKLPAMEKLFLHWLRHEQHPDALKRGYSGVAWNADRKKVLASLFAVANDKAQPALNRAQVLLALNVLADTDTLKNLRPLLADRTVVGTTQGDDRKQQQTQIRDVAMGVGVLVAGQKLEDYGFEPSATRLGTLYLWYYCRMPDDAVREASHAKWRAWLAKAEAAATK